MDRQKEACPWFEQGFARKSESKQKRSDRQRVSTGNRKRICWCTHPNHSPCDEAAAGYEFGGGKRLQCDGDVKKCPLTPTELADA